MYNVHAHAGACTEAGAKRPKRIRPGREKVADHGQLGKIDRRFSLQSPGIGPPLDSLLVPM